MVNIKTLLPELNRLVKDLDEDLLARVAGDADIDAGLRQAFTQIEEGWPHRPGVRSLAGGLPRSGGRGVGAGLRLRAVHGRQPPDRRMLAGRARATAASWPRTRTNSSSAQHPHDTDREYFQHVFHEVGKIPAARDLFAEGKTPLWAVGPVGDAAMKLLKFWREIDAETGPPRAVVRRSRTATLGSWATCIRNSPSGPRRSTPCCRRPCSSRSSFSTGRSTPALDEFGLERSG